MKESLLKHVVCPHCAGSLRLEVRARHEREIEQGRLACQTCAAVYPIINGIPRFVATDAYTKSFSLQWNIHRKTQVDSLSGHEESRKEFVRKTDFTDRDLKGRLVLDVGCGTGRYMEIAADWGAEVIGLDCSFAVNAAYENMGQREGIHIIQADLFKMPFRPATFDVIYSIGVLHHTPSTKDAFLGLPRFLGSRGQIAIWVYSNHNALFNYMSYHFRRLTTRLPTRLLYALCYLMLPLYYLNKVPFFGVILKQLIPVSDHPKWRWRVLDTFDWYSPKYQYKHTYYEVVQWFKQAGLTDIEILQVPVSCRGRKL